MISIVLMSIIFPISDGAGVAHSGPDAEFGQKPGLEKEPDPQYDEKYQCILQVPFPPDILF